MSTYYMGPKAMFLEGFLAGSGMSQVASAALEIVLARVVARQQFRLRSRAHMWYLCRPSWQLKRSWVSWHVYA